MFYSSLFYKINRRYFLLVTTWENATTLEKLKSPEGVLRCLNICSYIELT